ncbi:SRPBCC family protein [Cryptosporangium phraense]|uniref:SRPBCC domain-containing protein n=1 Tax=Cryptosporangium phraense TaxID=2593070 RepID=A0A545AFL8_9ACTN|nr:SRPBCC domain-containing protein [Cryptosporangium phraense]TQS40113.1 SRPBCC domain-containing protein [Cryptosporangium phraense]
MADIVHRIGVIAPLDDVYRAITTTDDLAAWWTRDTKSQDDTLLFRFGDVGGFDMQVKEADPAGRVRWLVTDGPEEWIGTDVNWRLEQRDQYTIVLFSHEGWREPVEFMYHCSTKWAVFLLSLKELVETGQGRPAPDDLQISDWH